jgi:hypothetical protein
VTGFAGPCSTDPCRRGCCFLGARCARSLAHAFRSRSAPEILPINSALFSQVFLKLPRTGHRDQNERTTFPRETEYFMSIRVDVRISGASGETYRSNWRSARVRSPAIVPCYVTDSSGKLHHIELISSAVLRFLSLRAMIPLKWDLPFSLTTSPSTRAIVA